jgi:hypothetical protein
MTTATTVNDLKTSKKNNAVRIQLTIGDNSNIAALSRTLETFDGSDLCNLVLVDGHVTHVRDWSSTYSLFEVIGNLSGLVHLGFENLGSISRQEEENEAPVSTFPITLITMLLQKARHRLETLCFDGVTLIGANIQELEEFVSALEGLVGLRHCVITNNFDLCQLELPQNVDAVITAISKLPLLVKADFVSYGWYEEGYPSQFLSAEPLKGLFNCPNLQELTLGEFNLANEGLKDVGRALAHCQMLRRLELHLAPSRTRTSLASLTLLASALKTNTALEIFKLEFEETCPKLDSFLIKVAEALALNSNTVLEKFKVSSPVSYGSAVEEAFVKLLQSNYTLQKVDFLTVEQKGEEDTEDDDEWFSLDASKRTELDLYLRLNKRGRKNLLLGNGVSRFKWVDTFAKDLTNDLDALHYYVRMNPWLCHTDDPEPTTQHQQQQPGTTQPDDTIASLHQVIALGFQNNQQEMQKLNGRHEGTAQTR